MVYIDTFLTSKLDGSHCSPSSLGQSTSSPREELPDCRWFGGSRARFLTPVVNRNPIPPTSSP